MTIPCICQDSIQKDLLDATLVSAMAEDDWYLVRGEERSVGDSVIPRTLTPRHRGADSVARHGSNRVPFYRETTCVGKLDVLLELFPGETTVCEARVSK